MKSVPKHQEISRQLRAEIAMKKHGDRGRLPSEAHLVKRFGVSRPTVIRALRDLEAEGLIERRAGSGTYVRNTSGKVTTSNQLGLLVPGRGTTEIFELICGELASLARAENHGLLWGGATFPQDDSDLSAKDAVKICNQFIEQRVRGVFFAPFELTADREKANREIAERFRSAGVPIVLLDRDLTPFPQRSEFDLVGIDNVGAGYLLCEHLIKLGCRRIAFVTRPNAAPTVDARIAGVREALIRHRLESRPDWVQRGDAEDPRFVRLLSAARRWDAFICANDLTAAKLLRSLKKKNIRVPNDVRVVGFDDAKYASLVEVPLTTVHQPSRDIAITAFRAMLERIAAPTLPARGLLLNSRLVVRESCGAYLQREGKRGG